jgi:hypothetical protein
VYYVSFLRPCRWTRAACPWAGRSCVPWASVSCSVTSLVASGSIIFSGDVGFIATVDAVRAWRGRRRRILRGFGNRVRLLLPLLIVGSAILDFRPIFASITLWGLKEVQGHYY